MGIEIVRLKQSQIDAVASVLGRAFHRDPLMEYVIRDADERSRLLPERFKRLLRLGCLFGEIWTTEDPIEGVAIWLPPDFKWSAEKIIASGLNEIPEIFGAGAVGRLREVVSREEFVRDRDIPEQHWYLLLVGVEPKRQGHGLGAQLLKPTLSRAEREGVPCYLETEEPRKVAFYLRCGFEQLVDGETVAHTGVRFWTFRRNPGRQQ
jgi:GNAT superfamily N-acetyltransferase